MSADTTTSTPAEEVPPSEAPTPPVDVAVATVEQSNLPPRQATAAEYDAPAEEKQEDDESEGDGTTDVSADINAGKNSVSEQYPPGYEPAHNSRFESRSTQSADASSSSPAMDTAATDTVAPSSLPPQQPTVERGERDSSGAEVTKGRVSEPQRSPEQPTQEGDDQFTPAGPTQTLEPDPKTKSELPQDDVQTTSVASGNDNTLEDSEDLADHRWEPSGAREPAGSAEPSDADKTIGPDDSFDQIGNDISTQLSNEPETGTDDGSAIPPGATGFEANREPDSDQENTHDASSEILTDSDQPTDGLDNDADDAVPLGMNDTEDSNGHGDEIIQYNDYLIPPSDGRLPAPPLEGADEPSEKLAEKWPLETTTMTVYEGTDRPMQAFLREMLTTEYGLNIEKWFDENVFGKRSPEPSGDRTVDYHVDFSVTREIHTATEFTGTEISDRQRPVRVDTQLSDVGANRFDSSTETPVEKIEHEDTGIDSNRDDSDTISTNRSAPSESALKTTDETDPNGQKYFMGRGDKEYERLAPSDYERVNVVEGIRKLSENTDKFLLFEQDIGMTEKADDSWSTKLHADQEVVHSVGDPAQPSAYWAVPNARTLDKDIDMGYGSADAALSPVEATGMCLCIAAWYLRETFKKRWGS